MISITAHNNLGTGGWSHYTLPEQLGNVGSEINRALMMKGKDNNRYVGACDRALELMDYILEDKRWKGLRLQEVARAREMICDAINGGKSYASTLEDMNNYFFAFALIARAKT